MSGSASASGAGPAAAPDLTTDQKIELICAAVTKARKSTHDSSRQSKRCIALTQQYTTPSSINQINIQNELVTEVLLWVRLDEDYKRDIEELHRAVLDGFKRVAGDAFLAFEADAMQEMNMTVFVNKLRLAGYCARDLYQFVEHNSKDFLKEESLVLKGAVMRSYELRTWILEYGSNVYEEMLSHCNGRPPTGRLVQALLGSSQSI